MSTQLPDYKYSVITTCKGRLHHLQETLPFLTSDEQAEVIVVDYDCPQGTSEWVQNAFGARTKLFKFNDKPKFNASIARNAGEQIATCDVLIFIDADIIAYKNSLRRMAEMCGPKTYVTISQNDKPSSKNNKQTTGTVAIHRSNFTTVAGYDEVFDSWGGEDSDIYNKLHEIGTENLKIDETLFASIAHSDTERLKYHDEKNLKKLSKQTQILVNVLAAARSSKITLTKDQKTKIYQALKNNKNIFNNINIKIESNNLYINCRRRNYFIGPMQVRVRSC